MELKQNTRNNNNDSVGLELIQVYKCFEDEDY